MSKINAIVKVKWLAEQLVSAPKNLRVLDGSWHLPNANRNARAEYDSEHIPGAMFYDFNEQFEEYSDEKVNRLVYMLPKPADFEARVGKLGINNDTHVVVYDTDDNFPVFSAQRVWWTFRAFGHEKVSVLEGGIRKWKNLDNPVTDVVPEVKEENFQARYISSLVKSFREIEENQSRKSFTLIDARPAAHVEGKVPNPRPDIKPGGIRGAVNMPFMGLMDMDQQTFKSKEELLKMFEQLPVDINTPIAATCGSGIAASMIALAGFVCGNKDVAVYDGAWTEFYQRARPDQMVNVPEVPTPAHGQ